MTRCVVGSVALRDDGRRGDGISGSLDCCTSTLSLKHTNGVSLPLALKHTLSPYCLFTKGQGLI